MQVKEKLLKEYPFKIEMHAHTSPASGCSDISPTDMVELYKKQGYHAVVITNHFIYTRFENQSKQEGIKSYMEDYIKTCKAAENSGLTILLGTEIRFTENDNDYLIYGIDEEMLGRICDYLPQGLETFRKEFKMEKSVFIQAHPFRDNMQEVPPELLDGIETFNMHPKHNSRVAVAVAYAKKHHLSITTAGTDMHHFGHEGMAALRTRTLPKDSYELAAILKSKDYIMEIASDAIVLP